MLKNGRYPLLGSLFLIGGAVEGSQKSDRLRVETRRLSEEGKEKKTREEEGGGEGVRKG